MSLTIPPINPERLLADLRTLRGFGAYQSGAHRLTYSPEDIDSRRWLADRMREAGLISEIDGIGNVIGCDPGQGPHLLLGSHTDTQPHGGWLDGALGVLCGLEIARSRHEAGLGGVDVASWADEEESWGEFLGSRSFIGALPDSEIDAAHSRYEARPLREALAAAGLADRSRAACRPDRYRFYLEAHIEQGEELEAKGLKLGIVTAIVGLWQYRIVVEGVQNHAGTTRMAVRRDAGLAAINLAAAIDRRFPDLAGPRSVWTVGRIALSPGAPSVIPGRAELLFQFRDTDPAVLERLEGGLRELVAEADEGPCKVRLETLSRTAPQPMDPALAAALEAAAERLAPGRHQRMPSGAGHDAQILARAMPAAMLFVPSIGGISHHWAENTAEADIVLGCQVLAAAVADLLTSIG